MGQSAEQGVGHPGQTNSPQCNEGIYDPVPITRYSFLLLLTQIPCFLQFVSSYIHLEKEAANQKLLFMPLPLPWCTFKQPSDLAAKEGSRKWRKKGRGDLGLSLLASLRLLLPPDVTVAPPPPYQRIWHCYSREKALGIYFYPNVPSALQKETQKIKSTSLERIWDENFLLKAPVLNQDLQTPLSADRISDLERRGCIFPNY